MRADDAERIDDLLLVEPERRADAGRRAPWRRTPRSDGSPPCAPPSAPPGSAGTWSRRRPRCRAAPRAPSGLCRSQAASTAGTITAPACTGPPSKVSSKSSPCAAVPLTKAAPAALMRARVADRGAGPVVVPAGERGLDVVLVARGDAEPDDVDQQVLAFARTRPAAAGSGDASADARHASRSDSCSRQTVSGERRSSVGESTATA